MTRRKDHIIAFLLGVFVAFGVLNTPKILAQRPSQPFEAGGQPGLSKDLSDYIKGYSDATKKYSIWRDMFFCPMGLLGKSHRL